MVQMQTNRGFTLIEVLIAAAIMFSVLAVAAVSFKTARQSSDKAAETVLLLAPLPLIMDTIRTQIRTNPLESLHGDGSFSGVRYAWSAETQFFLAPPSFVEPESLTLIQYEPRYRLYEVQLTLMHGVQERQFVYKELAWTPRSKVIQ